MVELLQRTTSNGHGCWPADYRLKYSTEIHTVPLFINGDGWLQNEYYKHNAQNGFFIIETKHVEI
jgi:hypothetical protein